MTGGKEATNGDKWASAAALIDGFMGNILQVKAHETRHISFYQCKTLIFKKASYVYYVTLCA